MDKEIEYLQKCLRTVIIGAAIGIIACLLASCSHNPAQLLLGEQTRLGFGDYGALNVAEGLLLVDCPRENTTLTIELDSDRGVVYDPASGSVKGVKKITRTVGAQITGYLVDLAEQSPEAAIQYLKNINKESK